MPVEVGLALELLRARVVAHHRSTRVRVLALGIVRLEVGFPVVASLEELAADAALVGGFLGSGPLTLLLDASHAGENRLNVELGKASVGAGVEIGDVARCVRFRPLGGLRSVELLGLRSEPFTGLFNFHSWGVGAL